MAINKEKSNLNAAREWRERERSEPLLAVPEDESDLSPQPHSLPRLSVVLPCSSSSSADHIPLPPKRKPLSHGDESMTVVLSAFYAKLLIVLGIALPITSTIQNELYTDISSDIFTMYLYIVSMVFLAYTFYHLRMAKKDRNDDNPQIERTEDKSEAQKRKRKLKNTYIFVISIASVLYSTKRTRYGSFYLHIGVAGFSVGSIIYSCLQFGGYFDLSGDCQLAIVAIKPFFRILFMVAQTVFIFSYTDILDPMRGVVLDRFGLMHLIATNVCEWLNVVIQETRDDIMAVAYDRPALIRYANISGPSKVVITDVLDNITFVEEYISMPYVNISESNFLHDFDNISFIEHQQGITENITDILTNVTIKNESWICNISDMITPLIRTMNPYLRPCGVEYSLLCSIIIVVIWNDICTVPGSKPLIQSIGNAALGKDAAKQCCPPHVKYNNHFSVDCGSAHKGLFMGVAVLAGTIVSLMLFNGLFQNEKHVDLALFQINVWETFLFILMTVGSAACIQRMRTLTVRRPTTSMPLEHALLLVTQCGVYLYYLFQIIGAGFVIQRYPEGSRATRIIAPLCAVVQSSCQTLLVLDAWSRRCRGGTRRPGRQLVTFLLVGNFALWLLNRVKNARAEFHPLQMQFYGVWAWTLITHVSVPLLVCYRFQATVCFYEIWKNSYKRKQDINDINLDEIKNHHVA